MRRTKAASGFSLIELCIAVTVVGLITAASIAAYNASAVNEKFKITNSRVSIVSTAIENYYFENGRYPCPADPAKSETDPDYGEEMRTSPTGQCVTTFTTGYRGDQPTYATSLILSGAVPFKALRIPVGDTLDKWNNKLSYAVVKRQTFTGASGFVAALPANTGLTINSYNFETNQVETITTAAQLIILSHGENGAGAWTAAGLQYAPCGSPATGTRDMNNCDGDKVFYRSFNNTSLTGGQNYYDDISRHRDAPPVKYWTYADANKNDILSKVTRIGINTNDPQYQLDVNGNMRIDNGKAVAVRICDLNSTCANTIEVGGPSSTTANTGFQCPSLKMGLTGVGAGGAECQIQTGLAATNCAGNYRYPKGIKMKSDGSFVVKCVNQLGAEAP